MNDNYIEFIDKIFERATDPIEQIKRIFDNNPIIFSIKEVCDHINKRLREFGYQLNMDYVEKANNIHYSCRSGSRGCSGGSRGCSGGSRGCSGGSHHEYDDDFERIISMSGTKKNQLIIALEA